MKKTRNFCLLLVLGCLLLFSGCSQLAVSLTEEEQNMIAEYIAQLILRHDKNYEPTLEETLTMTENTDKVQESFTVIGKEDSKEESETGNQDSSEASASGSGNTTSEKEEENYVELNSLFGQNEFQVVFAGYEEHRQYPEDGTDSYFSLDAPQGEKLVVMKFQITNKSSEEKTFSQPKEELKYRLDLDSESIARPSMTLLPNDMQYFSDTFAAGETKETVVVFAVPEKKEIAGTNLLVYSQTKTAIEKLK